MIVLKISCNCEIHRIQFAFAPDHACIRRALQELWPCSSIEWIKYVDEEGDLCTLVEATFTDFMETARQGRHGNQLLKVEVGCTTSPLAEEKVSIAEDLGYVEVFPAMANSHCRDAGDADGATGRRGEKRMRADDEDEESEFEKENEEDEMMKANEEHLQQLQKEKLEEEQFLSEWEIVGLDQVASTSSEDPLQPMVVEPKDDEMEAEMWALKEEGRVACEAVVENHLEEWLLTNQREPTFEDWMADIHPENVKDGVVDPRMYLEKSFHRLLWNTRTAALEGLSQAQKQKCYVDPRDCVNSPSAQASA